MNLDDFMPFIVIGLTAGSIYSLAALGLVLTYKTSGVFNFAHGAIAAVAAFASITPTRSSTAVCSSANCD